MTNLLKIDINSYIAEINLNRPEKANALNEELWFAIGACFKELDETEEVRVCILSGIGSNFSSGNERNVSDFDKLGITLIRADITNQKEPRERENQTGKTRETKTRARESQAQA